MKILCACYINVSNAQCTEHTHTHTEHSVNTHRRVIFAMASCDKRKRKIVWHAKRNIMGAVSWTILCTTTRRSANRARSVSLASHADMVESGKRCFIY